MGLRKRYNPMAESQNNWVVGNWVEDLQSVLVICVFESMWRFWLIWGCVVWFCPAPFEKYDLHTDCHSSKKIGKLHYFVKRQEVYLSCMWDTDLWWYKHHMVPKRQSMFWLRFLFFFQISLKWGQCTVDASRLEFFSAKYYRGIELLNFLGNGSLITCLG